MTEAAKAEAQETPKADGQQSNQNQTDSGAKAPEGATEQRPEDKLYDKTDPKEGENVEPKKEGEGDKSQKKDDSKDKGEVKYDLKLPEGSALKGEHVDKIAEFSKQRGLSNEQAQELLEWTNSAMPELRKEFEAEFVEGQKTHMGQVSEKWKEDLQNDKEVGGDHFKENAVLASRVVQKFFDKEFLGILDESRLGNHPGLFKGLTRIGKAIGEDKLVTEGAPTKREPKSHAETLYGY